jgi:hypothetical protein
MHLQRRRFSRQLGLKRLASWHPRRYAMRFEFRPQLHYDNHDVAQRLS